MLSNFIFILSFIQFYLGSIVNLNDFNFVKNAQDGIWLISYETEDCQECDKLNKIIAELSENTLTGNNIKYGKVNCKGDGKEICKSKEIKKFPSITMTNNQELIKKLEGDEINKENLEKFLIKNMPKKAQQIIELDRMNYEESINTGKPWIIKYYSAFCRDCVQIGQIFKQTVLESETENVNFGQLNCEFEWKLCQGLGVDNIIPIIRYYKDSKVVTQFDKEMKKDTLVKLIKDIDNNKNQTSENNQDNKNNDNKTSSQPASNSEGITESNIIISTTCNNTYKVLIVITALGLIGFIFYIKNNIKPNVKYSAVGKD